MGTGRLIYIPCCPVRVNSYTTKCSLQKPCVQSVKLSTSHDRDRARIILAVHLSGSMEALEGGEEVC